MKTTKTAPGKKLYDINRPLDPPRKLSGHLHFEINDRVSTPHGPGKVVKIADDRFLIALDNQIGQVWERISSLRLIGA